jgi:Ca-activated chloride channel family protein
MCAAAAVYGQFTSGVQLVEVYATVTDRQGALVTGLGASDFEVAEDGVPQAISAFAAGEFPLAVAVGIDRSFSMTGPRLTTAKVGAQAFVQALRPDDQLMVLAIGSGADVVAPLSADRAAARRAINAIDAWGTTPLYDGTLAALDAIQHAKGRRALVLLSDGADRGSETNAAALVDAVRRRDVLVYPVAIGAAGPPLFAELAAASGGRSLTGVYAKILARDLTLLARELRSQYLIGYAPLPRPRADTPQWHAIDVRVRGADVRVRARDGYFSH